MSAPFSAKVQIYDEKVKIWKTVSTLEGDIHEDIPIIAEAERLKHDWLVYFKTSKLRVETVYSN